MTVNGIPRDMYGADDGDTAFVPGGTRGQAIGDAAKFWGCDFIELRAYRTYVRIAQTEEKAERGWGPEVAVLTCSRDHPGAVPGWRVEAGWA